MRIKLRAYLLKITEHNLLFSFVVNMVLLTFYMILFKPSYETNDDNALSRIISGFNGENEPHMIFINYVIGVFLKAFYNINQAIPWYDLFQLFVCFCSLTAITYFLLSTIKSKRNVFLVMSFDIFVAYELYVKMQFTKTAGISSTAGVLLIVLFSLSKEKNIKNLIGITVGIILATIGFCFRYDMFLACSFLSAISALVILLSTYEAYKNAFAKRIITCAISFVVLLCSVGLVSLINNNAYSSPEWTDYFSRYKILSNIYDYNYLNFDEEKLATSEMRLDETDKQMLSRWNFGDPEYFSNSNLEVLSDSLVDTNKTFISFIKGYIKEMVAVLLINKYIPFIMFICTLILYIIRNKIKSKESIIVILSIFAMLVLYLYMYYKGRVFIHRVDCILWFTATIPIIMMINNSKGLQLKGKLTILLSVFILFQTSHYSDYRMLNRDNTVKNNNREVFSVIANDPKHLYLSTVSGVSFSEAYTIFDDIPFGTGKNFYPIGGWTSYAPFELTKLEKYGIYNPLSDVVNNENVYIIDEDIDGTIAYIHKHYDKNAKAILEKEINNHCIYKIIS